MNYEFVHLKHSYRAREGLKFHIRDVNTEMFLCKRNASVLICSGMKFDVKQTYNQSEICKWCIYGMKTLSREQKKEIGDQIIWDMAVGELYNNFNPLLPNFKKGEN